MLNLLSRFVDSNERNVKRLKPIVDEINGLEAEFQGLSDDEIRARMIELRDRDSRGAAPSEPSPEEIDAESSERRAELRKARHKEDVAHLRTVARRRRCPRCSRPPARSSGASWACGRSTSS